MSDWIEQYSAALAERDAREQAYAPYFDAYARLADRTSSLAARAPTKTPHSPRLDGSPQTSTSELANPPSDAVSLANELSNVRLDLQSTQKARTALQTTLTNTTQTLTSLQTQHTHTVAQHAAQTRARMDLERKLRDRDEELRLMGKVAEQAQDEMVALELQLSVAEARTAKAEAENQELVARWMTRMGEEAERVNRDSRWE